MNLDHWKSQADSHWKEFQPTRYKALVKDKKLGEALDEAAEATYRETSELEAEGFNPEEAFQMVRERYLFPPEEPGRTKESEPTRGAELMMDAQRLKNEIQGMLNSDSDDFTR